MDTNQNSLRDKYLLRNGSDAEIPTGSTYTSGNASFTDLMTCAGAYNGIWRIKVKWLSENLLMKIISIVSHIVSET